MRGGDCGAEADGLRGVLIGEGRRVVCAIDLQSGFVS